MWLAGKYTLCINGYMCEPVGAGPAQVQEQSPRQATLSQHWSQTERWETFLIINTIICRCWNLRRHLEELQHHLVFQEPCKQHLFNKITSSTCCDVLLYIFDPVFLRVNIDCKDVMILKLSELRWLVSKRPVFRMKTSNQGESNLLPCSFFFLSFIFLAFKIKQWTHWSETSWNILPALVMSSFARLWRKKITMWGKCTKDRGSSHIIIHMCISDARLEQP